MKEMNCIILYILFIYYINNIKDNYNFTIAIIYLFQYIFVMKETTCKINNNKLI